MRGGARRDLRRRGLRQRVRRASHPPNAVRCAINFQHCPTLHSLAADAAALGQADVLHVVVRRRGFAAEDMLGRGYTVAIPVRCVARASAARSLRRRRGPKLRTQGVILLAGRMEQCMCLLRTCWLVVALAGLINANSRWRSRGPSDTAGASSPAIASYICQGTHKMKRVASVAARKSEKARERHAADLLRRFAEIASL